MGALGFLLKYLPTIPVYVQGGLAVADAVAIGLEKAEQLKKENREPTEADWDEVNASIAAKRKRLHG